MKKYLILFIVISGSKIPLGCNQGVWEKGEIYDTYRPKHPHFSIQKRKFIYNTLIDTNYLYEQATYFPNWDGHLIKHNMGVFSDGRLILNTRKDDSDAEIISTNSWETALIIGYYTTVGDKIKLEYFEDLDDGNYTDKEGIIKKDTIIFEKKVHLLFTSEIRKEMYVKTKYLIRK